MKARQSRLDGDNYPPDRDCSHTEPNKADEERAAAPPFTPRVAAASAGSCGTIAGDDVSTARITGGECRRLRTQKVVYNGAIPTGFLRLSKVAVSYCFGDTGGKKLAIVSRKKVVAMGQAWSMLWDVQLPFNCYETTHTWTPHCHQASVDLFASVLLSTLPLHALLYLGSFLTKSAKTSWKDRLGEATRNTLRSSVCVAYCFYFLLAFNCGSRLLLGAKPLFCKHAQSSEGCEGSMSMCLAVALAGVLQPHLVRPSYRAFIDRVSGYRMRFINVPAIATLGYGTTSLVPGGSEIPELNPRFLSRKYTETLWIWSQ
ncbi:unnamed protein product [Ixodes pacificus]